MGRLCRFAVVVSVGVFVLGAVGCTPGDPDPEASATSSPPVSSAPASPPETDEERAERERGEHAIEVYVKSKDELDRLLKGGESAPSPEFRKYAAESYLSAATDLLEQVAADGAHLEGDGQRLGAWVVGNTTETKARIISCEDGAGTYYADEDGDPIGTNDEPMLIQRAEVMKVSGGAWKVTLVETQSHTTFEGTDCADAS